MTHLTWIYVLVLGAISVGITAIYAKFHYRSEDVPSDPSAPTPPVIVPEPDTASKSPPEAQNSPVEPITIPKPPTMRILDTFCHSIEEYEGGPNDANHKNNNPGNCRCSPVGYLPKYGNVRCSPAGFAIFPTYEQGWEYLQATVLHRAHMYPDWTIYQFFGDNVHGWSPSADGNNPKAYAEWVARRCLVSPTTTLAKLFNGVK